MVVRKKKSGLGKVIGGLKKFGSGGKKTRKLRKLFIPSSLPRR